MSLGAAPGIPKTYVEDYRLISFFGRLNYNFKNRYIFAATVRSDGTSKFGIDNKWGTFPSASAGWVISEEPFWKQKDVFIKAYASYGMAGNNRIANYSSLATLASGFYPLSKTASTSYAPNKLPNPGLQWEAVISSNFGIDLGFFNNRLTSTIEYYINQTDKLLLNANVPMTSGFSTILKNIGKTQNNGLELTVNSRNISRKDFTWNTSLNISFPTSKVISLTEGVESFQLNTYFRQSAENDYIVKVGEPVGLMFGYKVDGLYQVDDFVYNEATKKYILKEGIPYSTNYLPQPGHFKYRDILKDGFITPDDRTVI
jgi:outer membrane cobalamin receptor